MLVAQIAYNHLDPSARVWCDALVAVPLTYGGDSTSNFVTAAVWADDYKSQLGTAIWHGSAVMWNPSLNSDAIRSTPGRV